jgi:hypothetical protein
MPFWLKTTGFIIDFQGLIKILTLLIPPEMITFPGISGS